MSAADASAVTLRALEGEPLADDALREMITATATAIAERQGIEVLDVQTTSASVTVTLRTGHIQSIGFAAELRRVTTDWYTRKYQESTLWGEPPIDDAETGEQWKQA